MCVGTLGNYYCFHLVRLHPGNHGRYQCHCINLFHFGFCLPLCVCACMHVRVIQKVPAIVSPDMKKTGA